MSQVSCHFETGGCAVLKSESNDIAGNQVRTESLNEMIKVLVDFASTFMSNFGNFNARLGTKTIEHVSEVESFQPY